MNFNIPPVGGPDRTGPAPRSAPPPPKTDFAASLDAAVNVSTLPASPPESVLEDMNEAARVAEVLHSQQRELHFEPPEGGRVIVQVRDLDGNVIRTIPPAHALEIAHLHDHATRARGLEVQLTLLRAQHLGHARGLAHVLEHALRR